MNTPNLLQQLNEDLASVAERAGKSLVQVNNGGRSGGAGIICREDGLILTNAHVVRTSSPHVTLPDGRALQAQVLAHDPEHDLACLKVDAQGLPAIELGDSKGLQPGQWVLALGHPWGVTGAVTAGAVIGVGGRWPEMPAGRSEWVVAGLNLRPGNSGGPLVDAQGRLVGINTIMTGPEVGAAVPVHVVKAFLDKALSAGARPDMPGRRGRRSRQTPIY